MHNEYCLCPSYCHSRSSFLTFLSCYYRHRTCHKCLFMLSGEKMTTDVMRLVCTLKLLLWLAPRFLSPLVKVDDSCPANLCHHLQEVLRWIRGPLSCLFDHQFPRAGGELIDAVQYCLDIIREHPLVFSQLELGRTWRAILLNLRVGASQTRTHYRPV